MVLEFTKMHGLGNDFIVIDARNRVLDFTPEAIARLSDRRTGIGCDQFVVIRGGTEDAHASVDLFNNTGNPVEACGNAMRCVASFVREGAQDHVYLRTVAGRLLCEFVGDDALNVHMGKVRFDGQDLPTQATVPGTIATYALNIGNPHLVVLMDRIIEDADLRKFGAKLERDALFSQGANIEFLTLHDDHLHMRVWERGVGMTQACGSGACAAIVAAKLFGWATHEALVRLDGGDLLMRVDDDLHVQMQGAFARVYDGQLCAGWENAK